MEFRATWSLFLYIKHIDINVPFGNNFFCAKLSHVVDKLTLENVNLTKVYSSSAFLMGHSYILVKMVLLPHGIVLQKQGLIASFMLSSNNS